MCHAGIYVTLATNFFICKILLCYAPNIGSITELEGSAQDFCVFAGCYCIRDSFDCPAPRMSSQPAVNFLDPLRANDRDSGRVALLGLGVIRKEDDSFLRCVRSEISGQWCEVQGLR